MSSKISHSDRRILMSFYDCPECTSWGWGLAGSLCEGTPGFPAQNRVSSSRHSWASQPQMCDISEKEEWGRVWEVILSGQEEVLQPQSEVPCSLQRRALCRSFWCNLTICTHFWCTDNQTRWAHCNLFRTQWWQLDMSWQRLQPPKSLCCNRFTLRNCSDGYNLCWSSWKHEAGVAELVLDHGPHSQSPCASLVSHHPALLCNK